MKIKSLFTIASAFSLFTSVSSFAVPMMSFYSTGFGGGGGGYFPGHPGGGGGYFNGHPAGSSWGAYRDAERRAAEARRRAEERRRVEAERRARHVERERRAEVARVAVIETWESRIGDLSYRLEEARNTSSLSEAAAESDYFTRFRADLEEGIREFNGDERIEHLRGQLTERERWAEEARLSRQRSNEIRDAHENASRASYEVMTLVAHANEILPHVTAHLEQAATDYVRHQLETSQTVARHAVVMAVQGRPRATVQLLSDFAVDTATSINAFLGGVSSGFYDGLLTPIQVARAIYNRPELITRLSHNIMNVLTARPAEMAQAVGIVFQHVADAVYRFEVMLAYGTPEQRGHALGELGANVMLGIAGGEVGVAARGALEGMAANLAEGGANEALGAALHEGLQAAEQLAPEMAAIEQRVAQAAGVEAQELAAAATEAGAGFLDSVGLGTIGTDSPFNLNRTHRLQPGNLERVRELIQREGGIRETIKYVEHDGRRYIVDGNHRARAAMELGIQEVPVERVELPYRGYRTVDDLLNR